MPWPTTSRHARGYGTAWDHTRQRILVRDCGLCQPCMKAARITAAKEVDHIISKAKGGAEDDDNLQAICHACHVEKTQRECGIEPKVSIGLDGWPQTGKR